MGMARWIQGAVLCVTMLLAGGCITTTTIDFESPAGTKMDLRKKEYVFPVVIKLPQRTVVGEEDRKGFDVEMVIPDEMTGEELSCKGKLYIYKAELTDVDVLARNFFRIPPDKVASLRQGAAVTIEGLSADGTKKLYRTVLGVCKE